MTIEFYKKHLVIKEISEKIQPKINGAALIFGSYASGNNKEGSDLDILIIGKCNEKQIDDISKTYNVETSIKIYPKLEEGILKKEALKNHIFIKNAEHIIEVLLYGKD